MNTAARLGAYGAGLAVVFGGAFVAADAVVPQSTVANWTNEAEGHDMSANGVDSHSSHSGSGSHDMSAMSGMSGADSIALVPGVTSARDGYVLSPVTAPTQVGEQGTLSFSITDADGGALSEYVTSHEKDLHLIVVRTDGTQFRHVHPTMDDDGTWSLPWEWTEAGTYRVYADFVPATEDATTLTLTRTVEVGGQFAPASPELTKTASVGDYTVDINGDIAAGAGSELTLTVSKDGQPVTDIQPYLGAFGHLVALRDGDLAYLHVHPEGDEPQDGETSGPDVGFHAEAPTAGRYYLYFDFKVDGQVFSAPFVLDTTDNSGANAATESESESESDGSTTESESHDSDSHSH